MLLPLYDGFLSRHCPLAQSFQIHFASISLCHFLGSALCIVLWRRSRPTPQS